jgi:redox-sensitive bicupin YhaK (pirin superfamily)|tara:strand:- start:218 stop:1015 length:798 start_codon:yes stop_codon:yes gene_type:complete
MTSDGAGVKIKRLIGGNLIAEQDPFLLFDEFLSDDPNDYIGGFPDHPHRGFETVTYMLAGKMRHQDNRGNSGLLEAGSVQWMTAGKGLVHSEMPEQENGLMWGFQLWINLPAKSKMIPPRYQDIPPQNIPEVEILDGALIRVIAGQFNNVEGPIHGIDAEPLYLDIRLGNATSLEIPIPSTHSAFAYCYEGEVCISGNLVEKGKLVSLSEGDYITVKGCSVSSQDSLILVAGKPFSEPIVRYGPFVMNTKEEIQQAIHDAQNGLI